MLSKSILTKGGVFFAFALLIALTGCRNGNLFAPYDDLTAFTGNGKIERADYLLSQMMYEDAEKLYKQVYDSNPKDSTVMDGALRGLGKVSFLYRAGKGDDGFYAAYLKKSIDFFDEYSDNLNITNEVMIEELEKIFEPNTSKYIKDAFNYFKRIQDKTEADEFDFLLATAFHMVIEMTYLGTDVLNAFDTITDLQERATKFDEDFAAYNETEVAPEKTDPEYPAYKAKERASTVAATKLSVGIIHGLTLVSETTNKVYEVTDILADYNKSYSNVKAKNELVVELNKLTVDAEAKIAEELDKFTDQLRDLDGLIANLEGDQTPGGGEGESSVTDQIREMGDQSLLDLGFVDDDNKDRILADMGWTEEELDNFRIQDVGTDPDKFDEFLTLLPILADVHDMGDDVIAEIPSLDSISPTEKDFLMSMIAGIFD